MTKSYPVSTVGFLIEGYCMTRLNATLRFLEGEGPDPKELDPDFATLSEAGDVLGELYDHDSILEWLKNKMGNTDAQFISEFTGTAETFDNVLSDGEDVDMEYDCDPITFLPMRYEPAYVGKGPYDSTDDMVEEMRAIFGELLPDNFPYAKYICKIDGTYEC